MHHYRQDLMRMRQGDSDRDTPRIWLLGVPILIGLFIWKPSPLLILIAILAFPQAWKILKDKSIPNPNYYTVNGKSRLSYTIQYLLLVGLLAVFAYQAHEMLPPVSS